VFSFINAPSGWNPAAADLSECEWESVKPLFDGLKREKFNLGQNTLNFYDEREPELLRIQQEITSRSNTDVLSLWYCLAGGE
jgi:S-DNA-T family DNA segregation ATPase FtsK/SpoIIIE